MIQRMKWAWLFACVAGLFCPGSAAAEEPKVFTAQIKLCVQEAAGGMKSVITRLRITTDANGVTQVVCDELTAHLAVQVVAGAVLQHRVDASLWETDAEGKSTQLSSSCLITLTGFPVLSETCCDQRKVTMEVLVTER